MPSCLIDRVAGPSGQGAKYKLGFVDRLLATLVHLRHGVTHDVLACWFQVDRSTITRAVAEVRPRSPMSSPTWLRSLQVAAFVHRFGRRATGRASADVHEKWVLAQILSSGRGG
ncbi:helix-turn-helix domain-containing protein [Streptomyces flavidovirens]